LATPLGGISPQRRVFLTPKLVVVPQNVKKSPGKYYIGEYYRKKFLPLKPFGKCATHENLKEGKTFPKPPTS